MAKEIKRVDVILQDTFYDFSTLVYTERSDGDGFIDRALLEFLDEARYHFIGNNGSHEGVSLDMVLYEDEAGEKEFMKLHQSLLEPKRFSIDWEILLEREEKLAEQELQAWLNDAISIDGFNINTYRAHNVFPIF